MMLKKLASQWAKFKIIVFKLTSEISGHADGLLAVEIGSNCSLLKENVHHITDCLLKISSYLEHIHIQIFKPINKRNFLFDTHFDDDFLLLYD